MAEHDLHINKLIGWHLPHLRLQMDRLLSLRKPLESSNHQSECAQLQYNLLAIVKRRQTLRLLLLLPQ